MLSLFVEDVHVLHVRLVEHRELEEEDPEAKTMRLFMTDQILPVAGKWLQSLRLMSVSLPERKGDDTVVSLLRSILTVYPLEGVAGMEGELVSLLRAYPRVMEEVAESEIREIRSNFMEKSDTLPSVLSLKRLYVKRLDTTHDSLLLHLLLRNSTLLRIVILKQRRHS